jgi:hypothetical protein
MIDERTKFVLLRTKEFVVDKREKVRSIVEKDEVFN